MYFLSASGTSKNHFCKAYEVGTYVHLILTSMYVKSESILHADALSRLEFVVDGLCPEVRNSL